MGELESQYLMPTGFEPVEVDRSRDPSVASTSGLSAKPTKRIESAMY